MSNWINIKNQLPEKNKIVLVSDNRQITLAFLLNDVWNQPGTWEKLNGITHWMLLPKLPGMLTEGENQIYCTDEPPERPDDALDDEA